MEWILEKQLVSKIIISLEKADTFNKSHFINEKDSDVSFLTNTALCVYCGALKFHTRCNTKISMIYKLGLQNGGYVGGMTNNFQHPRGL